MERTPILFIAILAILGSCRAEFGGSCTTPDGRAGKCTTLKKCGMLNQCDQHRRHMANVTDFLQRSICGTDNRGKNAYCCENEYLYSATSIASNPCYPEVLPNRLAAQLPQDCGRSIKDSRIFGGNVSYPDVFPWVVVLEYDTPKGPTSPCGGALISDRHVMTAAHCLTSMPADAILKSVRLGEYDKSKDLDCLEDSKDPTKKECMPPVVSIPIETKVYHDEWPARTMANRAGDIAILKLAHSVTFSDTIKPICLPGTTDYPSKLTVAGWGETETSSHSNIKLQVTVPVIPLNQCKNVYSDRFMKIDRHICAVSNGTDSCRGDSGGPLMARAIDTRGKPRWIAYGIVSFGGTNCGTYESPGVYTKVNDYLGWILSKLN